MTATDQPNKRQRSRTGCLTCRRRRVKCDESPGVCNNCRSFGVQCEWATTVNGHTVVPSSNLLPSTSATRSRRPACDACRAAKTRCDRDLPSCERCRLDRLDCVYSHRRRRSAQVQQDLGPAEGVQSNGNDNMLPSSNFASFSQARVRNLTSPFSASPFLAAEDKLCSRADLDRHLDAFFRHVHPEMAMSFIHRGHLYRRLEESWASNGKIEAGQQSISPLLLKCMAAASARFLDNADPSHPDGGALPEEWVRDAKMSITLELDRFSISNLAATLCVIHHEYCSGRIGSAWTWTSLAARMCVGMSLYLEPPAPPSSLSNPQEKNTSWTEREARRRIVWATVCADAWSACGLSECTTFDRRLLDRLPLPSTERDFAFGHAQGSETPPATLSTELLYGQLKGISANHVWLTILGSDVQWYLKHISDDPRPWQKGSPFHQLQKRLDNWIASTAPDIQFNVSNMYARKDDPDFGSWIHTHLHADQIGFVLRCFTMPGYEDTLPAGHLDGAPPGWIDQTREACAKHARDLAEKVLAVTQRFPGFIPANWTWNIFVYGSVREQLAFLSLQRDLSPSLGTQSIVDPFGSSLSTKDMTDGLQAMIFLLYKMTTWFDQNHRIARDLLRMVMKEGINLQAEWIDRLRSRMSDDNTPGQVRSQVLTRMPFLRRYIRHPEVDDLGSAAEHKNSSLNASTIHTIPSSSERQTWTQSSGGTRSSHSFQDLLNSQIATTKTAEPGDDPEPQNTHQRHAVSTPSLNFDLFDILNNSDPNTQPMMSTPSVNQQYTLPWQQAPHFGIMGNDDGYLSLLDFETLGGLLPMSGTAPDDSQRDWSQAQ